MIMICTFGNRCPRRRLLKAPTAAATTTVEMTMVMATTAETLAATTFRDASDVLCSLPSLHLGALRIGRRMFPGHGGDEAACGGFGGVVEDDYKFLNRNVRKLFGMVRNMKGKWCNSCGKYH
jgi:hypothetical protein